MAKQTKIPIPKTELSDEQIKSLLELGLTSRIITNMQKKMLSYEQMIKKSGKKVEEIEARVWLQDRFGKEMIVPKRELPKLSKKELASWKPKDPTQFIRLFFPMVPSMNHMYRTARNGSRIMEPVARKLFVEIQDYLDIEVKKQKWEPIYNTLVVTDLWFFFPDAARRDSHNMLKFLLDTMDGILINDDYSLLPRTQDITIDRTNPRIEVVMYIKP